MVITKQLSRHNNGITLSNCTVADVFYVNTQSMLTVKRSCGTNSNSKFKKHSKKNKYINEAHQINKNNNKILPCTRNGEVTFDVLQMGVIKNIAKALHAPVSLWLDRQI